MKNKKLFKFIIALLIPTLILLAMLVKPVMVLCFGQQIILETKPVDPRDLFRGDHVILRYQINDIDISKFPQEIQMTKEDKSNKYRSYSYYDFSSVKDNSMYAVLKSNGQFHEVDYITLSKPKNELYIKCKLSRNNYDRVYVNNDNPVVPVTYNLDKYFVPENSGYELEKDARRGNLYATVKVLNGNPVLTDVNQK